MTASAPEPSDGFLPNMAGQRARKQKQLEDEIASLKAKLAEAERQRDINANAVTTWKGNYEAMCINVAEQRALADAAVAALEKYGQHIAGCAGKPLPEKGCACGLGAALERKDG